MVTYPQHLSIVEYKKEHTVKIDRIEWWQVNQFVHQEMVNSPDYAETHERWDLVPKFIVRLHTDDGHYGVGETQRGAQQEGVEAACRALIGVDPLALNLRQIPLGAAPGMLYKAMEVAVFDLVGRIRGMSMSQLLGGACRDAVATSYWAGLQNPDYSVAAAERAREGGFTCMKIKIMHGMDVIARLEKMLAVAPDLHFIVDAMQRYEDLDEMRELSHRLADLQVICIEDPLPKDRLDWYEVLRREAPTPIALHLGSTKQILDALAADAVDIFNCSPASLVEFVRMVDVAGAAGKPCWHGSGVDLGILDLGYIHACAVPENATIAHDILCEQLHVDDFVLHMPPRSGERVAVPTEPGHGGELDMDAVREYLLAAGEVR
jgi:muconate cycloisomerase